MRPGLPRLYLISDADRVGEDRFLQTLEAAIGAGLRLVQVREPDREGARLRSLLRRVEERLAERAWLILSVRPGAAGRERLELARESGAAGVHLGGARPRDVPGLRRDLGADRILGYSAHEATEARAALRGGADYVSLSPVFAPLSKTSDLPPLGPDGLARAARHAGGPMFALGGVTAETATELRARGAHGVAVIGAITDAPRPADATRDLLAALGE